MMRGTQLYIKPSAKIRQNYNEISALCKSTKEPVHLTKNGEGDLIVMDIDSFYRRELMLKLREELLLVDEDRAHGVADISVDESVANIRRAIEAQKEKRIGDAG
jgi:PHD/YefM family antitoxin component YafN of YafNO toxin-antitoxin module